MSSRVQGDKGARVSGRVTPSKLRRGAVVAVDGVLAVGTGALGGLFATGAASAAAPTPGWTGLQAPLPTGPDAPQTNPTAKMIQESCSSPVTCVDVGSYMDSGSTQHGLLETYAGGSWSALEVPLPGDAAPGGFSKALGTSCAVDGSCVAVGNYLTTGGGDASFVDTLSGGHWSALEAPLPSDAAGGSSAGAFLKSVDCVSAGSCVAVGSYRNTGGAEVGFIDTLASGHWSSQVAPHPAGAAGSTLVVLESVSCPSVGACAAGGLYENASSRPQGDLLSQMANGSWTALDTPLPADAATGAGAASLIGTSTPSPQAVSCGPSVCEAVGAYADTSGKARGLLERLSGGTWSGTEAPQPANAGPESNQNTQLGAASCTFDGCAVTGFYQDAATGQRPLIDTVNAAGAATATEGPQPTDMASGSSVHAALSAVSCLSLNQCTAVGSYANSAGRTVALIDSLSAGTWTNAPAALPSNAASGASARSELTAVSLTPGGGAAQAGGDFNDGAGNQQPLVNAYTPPEGYWTNASDGGIFSYGNAVFHGSAGSLRLNAPVVGMAATPGDGGYWEVATDGGIFSYGDANFYGSTGSLHLNKPVVGMAATPDGGGYWFVASDGGIFSYGDANFYGSTGSIHLNQPVVGMAATPDGKGYWLVATDGGIFSYGDANFYGSTGSIHLNQPVVGMAASATGNGYWLVASDGGIFTYGDAVFHGSSGSLVLNKPIVGMMSTFDGAGYWLVASDGGIFSYGNAGFQGSAGSLHLNAPMVGGTPT
jgi:hypothetical protein